MNVDLSWCDYYEHVHELPQSKMTLGIATFIGNKIEKFQDMEMDATSSAYGETLRPLSRALKLKTTMGEEHLITFMYECLPNFCYFYGCLGHIAKYCDMQFDDGFHDPSTDTSCGPWLRAPLSTRNHSQLSKHERSIGHSPSASPQQGSTRKGPAIFSDFGASSQGRNIGGIKMLVLKVREWQRASLMHKGSFGSRNKTEIRTLIW
ncbi:UNVERIFIED_CONTAM: hypothetical protein Slati_2525200 [Sesamum latifolium]|uniref:Zinc knuckle CX2CX4HX4C domain-containing protein n=1 Tax=Sesamum latifolium TaxID=2727402 RepID=A0AAW2WFM1_9LAMI